MTHKMVVSTELFELAREAFALAWLEADERPRTKSGVRTAAGLRAALSVLGVVVADEAGRKE